MDEFAFTKRMLVWDTFKSVLFNLFVIVEPLIYFRVCHGTPLPKM